jgi:hypothetical protein
MPTSEPEPDAVWADLRPVLDEEINGLPEKYRRPFVLCYLQGKTNEQAAELLGCPKGTILSRLAWARERLRTRLVRRGLAPSVGALAAGLSADRLSATVPEALAERAAEVALSFAWGSVVAKATPDSVPALAEGVLAAMSRTKIVTAVVLVMVLGLLGTGAGLASFYLQNGQPPQGQAPNPKAEAGRGGRLSELLKKRRDTAHEEFSFRNKEWEVGRLTDQNLLFGAALRLLDAELALSTGRAAQAAACKDHLTRMQHLGRIYSAQFEAGKLGPADRAMAQYYVLDAEIRLERTKRE